MRNYRTFLQKLLMLCGNGLLTALPRDKIQTCSRSSKQGDLFVFNPAELARRRPVWTALSGLWLDTELTDADLQHIARVAAASGYTLPELRHIYLHELAPVLGPNLLNVAGEWAGFDESSLHAAARRRAETRPSFWARLWPFAWLNRKLMTYATEPDWQRLAALLSAGREPTLGSMIPR